MVKGLGATRYGRPIEALAGVRRVNVAAKAVEKARTSRPPKRLARSPPGICMGLGLKGLMPKWMTP